MKKTFLLYLLLAFSACSNAQNFAMPQYIPIYHILTVDSIKLTSSSLPKNKPVMIIYFGPDCSHCQHLMNEMKPVMNKFKGMEVVMITFAQLKAIQVFYRDYDLKKFPNFIVGTEGYSDEVRKYYQLRTTPFIAIYDKTGKLSTYYEKAPKIDELLASIKKV